MIGNDKFVRLFGSVVAGDDEKLIQIVSEAVREGVAIVLNRPGTKIPTCTLSAQERNRADKTARDTAAQIGDANWSKRKHACGLAHALTVASLTATEEFPEGDSAKVRAKVGQIIRRVTKLNDGKQPNIGVELGRSRMLVVDVDTLEELEGFKNDWNMNQAGPMPGMTVLSPGKKNVDGEWVHKHGGHFWFNVPEGVELPAGQGAFRAPSGWVAMWSAHQVLVPPSTREEGAYTLIGQVDDTPEWITAKLSHEVEARMERARNTVLPDGTGDIDLWSFETPWSDLLEPDGWTNTRIPDSCSCDIWTAPGPHGFYKSATAHDIGCSVYDSKTAPPLHVWTFNPPEWMQDAFRQIGSTTLTKLRYVAWRDYGGSQKQALIGLGFNQAPVPANDLNDWTPEPVRGKSSTPAGAPSVADSDGFEGADGAEYPDDDEEAEPGVETLPEPDLEPADSWAPIDLSTVSESEVKATFLPRSDGVCLLYPGLMHSIHGEPESGKSWIVQAETVRLIKLGVHVLFLDFENDVRSVVPRFKALGATNQELKLIDYRNPDTKPDLLGKSWNRMFNSEEGDYGLIVIDGMTDALGLFGLGTNSNDEVSMFMRKFRILARRIQAALVLIDHVVKDKVSRGRWAIGGTSKMGAIDGAAYVVDVLEPMAKGKKGVLKLSVAKDKPGDVRQHATGFDADRLSDIGRFVLDATGEMINWQLQVPADPFETPDPIEHERNEGLEILILQELSLIAPAGVTSDELRRRIGKGKAAVLDALADLEPLGWVLKTPQLGKTRSRTEYTITERGQEEVA